MIINKLDTRSFVKLARTCKYMNKICFKSSDIKIPFERIYSLRVHENYEHSTLRIESGKGVFHRYTDRSRFLKKLTRMPFVYRIKFLEVSSWINDSILLKIRNYFSKFPRVIIRNISGIQAVDNWDALIEFIQDFRVESLGRLPVDVPLDVLSYITQNMKYVNYDGHIPDDVILSATSEHLYLLNAAISLNTFKELVKRYKSGLIGTSIVGLGWADDGEDPFVKACSEVMEIVHVDDINESVMKPSLIFVGDNSHCLGRKFSLLKYDGSIGIFYIKQKKNFGFNNAEETFRPPPGKGRTVFEEGRLTKSPHETREPLIQNSFIFDATIRDVLPKIINNLNPCSFVRLARTCKEMSRNCFKNKDIQIPCWSGEEDNCCYLSVHGNSTRRWFLEYHSSRGYIVRIKLNDQLLKKTARMPFVYTLKNVSILVQFDDRFNSRLRKFLDHFPRLNIRRIAQCRPVLNWEGFIEFLKDFRITRLSMTSDVNVAPLEVISFLTRNLVDFTYRKDIFDDFILGTTAKKMKLFRSSISKETFKQLIQKFVAGGLVWWLIRRGERPLRRREPDAFIEAVSEVIKTVQIECIDKNTMEPYTAYFTPSEPEKFHFLKSDGSLGSFNITPNYVQFGSYVYI